MKTSALLFVLACVPAAAGTTGVAASHETSPAAMEKSAQLDSASMEKALQRLPWKQFRAIVESVPQLKAGIDAYGPLGWQFVQANYSRYGWKKNIDKLDDVQKRRLAEQIRMAR